MDLLVIHVTDQQYGYEHVDWPEHWNPSSQLRLNPLVRSNKAHQRYGIEIWPNIPQQDSRPTNPPPNTHEQQRAAGTAAANIHHGRRSGGTSSSTRRQRRRRQQERRLQRRRWARLHRGGKKNFRRNFTSRWSLKNVNMNMKSEIRRAYITAL